MPLFLSRFSAVAVPNTSPLLQQQTTSNRALFRVTRINSVTAFAQVRLQSTNIRLTYEPPLHEVAPSYQSVSYESSIQPSANQRISNHVTQAQLPIACPGCGALSHTLNPREAGYYSRSRKAVKSYIRQELSPSSNAPENNDTETNQLACNEPTHQEGEDFSEKDAQHDVNTNIRTIPTCDRCHELVYNSKGQSIAHPTVEALVDSVAESPYRRNHVYHVLDAADFPMSLIPNVFDSLELAKPRSQNRRARYKFTAKPTVSFIITRSDLLGRSKEMVDRMMPYFQSVLRTALGRDGKNLRLGNVHLVSAKRGWWTKDIKENIWDRGGGNWLIGKVNVGKSNLFPVLFPKGSGDRAPVYAELKEQQHHDEVGVPMSNDHSMLLQEESLLPPAQVEVPFPTMPIVSSLPGTTASPIRLPFGNGKGELIDLPGLDRGNLEKYVRSENKSDLVMQFRPTVKQIVIKPGQSLLLGGGLVRITPQLDPNDRSTTMLAYPFVPIEAHVTSTEKAIATQSQQRMSGIKSILAKGMAGHIKHAGMMSLNTDVTKARSGPLLRAKVPLSRLAFKVYSTDILIEGIGWVELVCQVRRGQQLGSLQEQHHNQPELTNVTDEVETVTQSGISSEQTPLSAERMELFSPQSRPGREVMDVLHSNDFPLPQVEIVSPEGSFVGQRRPLGASLMWDEGSKRRRRAAAAARPRKPMKGAKKREKALQRANTTSS